MFFFFAALVPVAPRALARRALALALVLCALCAQLRVASAAQQAEGGTAAAVARILERCEHSFVPGLYAFESISHGDAPTPEEVEAAKAYVAGLRPRALTAAGPQEQQILELTNQHLEQQGRPPIATMRALARPQGPKHYGPSQLAFESPLSWAFSTQPVQAEGESPSGSWREVSNRHGYWRKRLPHPRRGEEWNLEPSDLTRLRAIAAGPSGVLKLLVTVEHLARLALGGGPLAEVLGVSAPSVELVPNGFLIEVRDSRLALGMTGTALELLPARPAGWQEIAGWARVEFESDGEGGLDVLKLTWIDLEQHPVSEWILWSLGPQRVPQRVLRRLYQLGGGRVVYEQRDEVRALGPLESSPEDFVLPPGAQVHDGRFEVPVSYFIPADGRLPSGAEMEAESRSVTREVLGLLRRSSHGDDESVAGTAARSEAEGAAEATTRAAAQAGAKQGSRAPVWLAVLGGLALGVGGWLWWRHRPRPGATAEPHGGGAR